jgi:hypothetical protein
MLNSGNVVLVVEVELVVVVLFEPDTANPTLTPVTITIATTSPKTTVLFT